jgi:transposase
MPRGIQFSDDLKKRMVDLHNIDQKSFAEIGRILNLRREVVSKIVRRCHERGTTKSFKKPGRPSKTTAHQDRLIHRSSLKNPRFTAEQVQIDSGVNNVSIRTIRRQIWITWSPPSEETNGLPQKQKETTSIRPQSHSLDPKSMAKSALE